MTKKRLFVKVSGIVQGVGFRPFVYNLALSENLKGWVNNNSEGVYIDLEGSPQNLESFLYNLEHKYPPLARIEGIEAEERKLENYKDFSIKESERNEQRITLISPDIALCHECKEDILNPDNRRYGYPFTNCTNCGPRFSIIKSIPYDRDKTTMEVFKMCDLCQDEYTNPLNRRFHAQPNACGDCGPHIWIIDSDGKKVTPQNLTSHNHSQTNFSIIRDTVDKLKEGKIFAIKGLTGFHLACNALDSSAVKLLRDRKRRPFKPFAVMMKDIDTVKKYCVVNEKEEELLTGIRKPIVILDQKEGYNLPEAIAPNQRTLGVMLPYTPLHELIFQEDIEVLIMTSANYYGLPLEHDNATAQSHLCSIVDYFLLHNRDIYIPVDDSVTKVTGGEERIIRRARGYAPDPLRYADVNPILACGPNMKNTFSIGKDNFVFISQHNGDLENLETFEHYKRNIEHFKKIFKFIPKYIAHDLHPHYSSTVYAEEFGAERIPVQHHHAHIASCLVENNISSKVIGIAYDGTGYGTDGKIWGGEFLFADLMDFSRFGHLEYIKLPGGEKAINEPWRMAVAYIHSAFSKSSSSMENSKTVIKELYGEDGLQLLKVLNSNFNWPETSSIGRLFDAAASLIGINNKITYEGQASIELEAAIKSTGEHSYPYDINEENGCFIICPSKIILSILNDRAAGISKELMSLKFHNTVVNFTLELCCKLRNKLNTNEVALSGGVFQNTYLLKKLVARLEEEAFVVYTHKQVPSNDGGVSLGQIAVADSIIKNSNV